MKKLIMSVVSVLLAGTAFCAVTTHLSLDCRGAKVADNSHPLVYDASWYEGGATAKITANGQEIVSGTAGVYAWTPSFDGVCLLALNVYNASGDVVGTESVFCLSREDMTELVIPEGTTEIGEYAFAGGQFTSVTIPNSVTKVTPTAFAGCENIVEVSLGSGLFGVHICDEPEGDWSDIGNGQYRSKAIGNNGSTQMSVHLNLKEAQTCSFKWKVSSESGYDKLEYSVDGVKVTDISGSRDWEAKDLPLEAGEYTIVWRYYKDGSSSSGEDCGWVDLSELLAAKRVSLASIFPDSFEIIRSVSIGDGAGTIDSGMFANCGSLETIDIPSDVTKIGANAFAGCESLSRVNVPSMADWLGISFANAEANPLHIGAALYVGGEKLAELVIPGGTTEIGEYAFAGGQFTAVTIPNSVTNVAPTAFVGCSNVVEVACGRLTGMGVERQQYAEILLGFDGDFVNAGERGGELVNNGGQFVSDRFGQEGRACYFNGQGKNAYFANDSAIKVEDTFTIAFWFKTDVSVSSHGSSSTAWNPGNYAFFPANSGSGSGFGVKVGTDGVQVCEHGNNYLPTVLNYAADIGSDWNHVAVAVENSGAIRLYLNGELVSTGNGSTRKRYAVPAGVGGGEWGYYTGTVDDVAVFDYAMTDEEVLKLVMPTFMISELTIADLFPDSFAGIKSVTISDGFETFDGVLLAGCESLESLVLPESVKRIEAGALDEFNLLRSVMLPPVAQLEDFGLDDIPEAQRGELGLRYDENGFMIWNGWLLDYEDRWASELTVPEGVIGIGQYALSDMELERLVLPSTLKYIGSQAISYQWALEDLEIPDSVEYIGAGAFEDCSYMGTITFGSGLREIGKRAFAECQSLATVSPAFGLEMVGEEAFADCVRMMSVSLPVTVTNVASSAFTGCKSLVGVMTPAATAPLSQWFRPIYTQIKNVTVTAGEVEVCSNMFKGCSALVSASLSEGVTNIGAGAFMDCSQLPEVVLPSTLVAVGAEAFRNCDALTAIGLPNAVERIGARAFSDCGNLQNVSLSRNLCELPEQAFDSCGRLASIIVPASVTNLGARVFGGAIKAAYYLGDAPAYDANVYAATPSSLTTYVNYGTFGWDGLAHSRNLPPRWPVGNDYSRAIATWEPVRYDVTFDAGEGVFTSPVAARTYACEQVVGTAYSLPPYNPVRTGYKFDGWWDSETGGTRITPSSGVQLQKAHALYAHWTRGRTITVRFNANGGNVTPRELDYIAEVPYGEFPLPTREHHVFDGWFTAPQGGQLVRISMEAPLADRELFAHWSPARYQIRYHANNGTDATMSQGFTYGETVMLRRNPFSCADCMFAGWSVAPGGAAVYGDGHVLESIGAIQDGVIDLYAVWTGKTYAVRFDANGGQGQMAGQTFVMGVAQPLLTCAYARSGYRFLGWALSPSAQIKFADGEVVADLSAHQGGTVDLFAVWGIAGQKTTVIFDAGEGTVDVASVEREPGERFGDLPVPVRDGFAFGGWRDAHGDLVTEDSLVPPGEVWLTTDWGKSVRISLRFCHGWRWIWRPFGHRFGRLPVLPREQAPYRGWCFRGWAYDLAGERLVSPEDLVPEVDTELYAVWIQEGEAADVDVPAVEYDDAGFVIWEGWLLSCQNKSVVSIAIPEGVIGIGQEALADMYDLQKVIFPSTLREIGKRAFANDTYLDLVELPESVVSIGEEAFANCTWLQSLSLGDGLETVGAGAFRGCAQLAKAAFGDGLLEVGEHAFADCWRMLSVAIPLSVTNVAATAFSGCSSLTGLTVPTHRAPLSVWFEPVYRQLRDVTVPVGETEVCSNVFQGCTALVSVALPEGVTNIAEGAFWDCTALPDIVLPSSLQEIGADAFRNCDALKAIGLPESVERIGARAFYDCYRLADVSLSRCLTELPAQAFDSCSYLDSIVVPELVVNLGPRVFGSAMRAVYYVGNAPQYDDDVYAATSGNLTTYVKQGSKGWEGRDKPKSRVLPERWPADNASSRPLTTWEPVQYDVTFDAGEGVFQPDQANTYACQQTVGTAYSLPPYNPTSPGRKFAGWWTEAIGGAQITPSTGVKLDRAHTLYAHWTGGTAVAVRFNACGGVVEPNEGPYTAGETYGFFPVPTREHYVFVGWFTAPTGGGRVRESTEVPAADVELFAQWAPAPYEIRFHANNGTGATASQSFVYGQSVTLHANIFGCKDCSFAGWSLTPGGAAVYADRATIPGLAAIEDGVIDLYAVWAGSVYSVRFDSHGGTGTMDNQTFVIGVPQELSHCTFTRAGYVFAGWARSTDGEICFGDGEAVTGLTEVRNATVVLYAVWVRDPAAVWTLNEYLNCTNLTFALGGDEPHWLGLKTARAEKVGMMRSGAIGDSQTNWIETVVSGPGTIRFWWKASGEYEASKKGVITRYDYAEFTVDGEAIGEIGDESDWAEVVYEVTGAGPHAIRWMYHKDESGSDGDDCAWLSEVSWEPTQVAEPIPELPENPTADDVQSALAGSADSALLVHIADAATYNAYREWALKIGAAEVKASPFAWASFATDSAALLAKMPTDEDLEVEEFKPSPTAGSFDFTVSVKDVTIGDKASVDNLKKLFGLEGAESLDSAAFSSENVALDFKEPQDGKLKFTATPAVDNVKSFFMKMKVK